MGLASQQNAGGQPSRTALAGDGGGSGLDTERRVPGRGAREEGSTRRGTLSTAYRLSSAQTACGSATGTPVELCGAWTHGVSGSPIESRTLILQQAMS